MIWLTGHLLGVLALTAVLAGFAGWCWHAFKHADASQALDAERARLRAELIRRAQMGSGTDTVSVLHDPDLADENEALRLSARRQGERVTQLEREMEALHAAQAGSERLRAENADLRDAVQSREAQVRAADGLRARIVELETALAQPTALVAHAPQAAFAAPEVARDASAEAALRWRAFYFERRAAYQAAEHSEALAAAQRIPPVAQADQEQEQITQWRLRYFSARAAYLEQRLSALEKTAPAPEALAAIAPPEEDTEAAEHARRQAWRLSYMDRRLESFAEQAREAVGAAESGAQALAAKLLVSEREAAQAEGRVTSAQEEAFGYLTRAESAEAEQQSLRARVSQQDTDIAALRLGLQEAQAELAAEPKEDGEKTRLRWKATYLEARVRQLEDHAFSVVPAAVLDTRVGPAHADFVPPRPATASATQRPKRLAAPRGGAPDDLRLIPGITPQIESKLNASGIFHFDQIADWSAPEAAWVDQYLAMRGQIERDGWISQAARLTRGETALQRIVTSPN